MNRRTTLAAIIVAALALMPSSAHAILTSCSVTATGVDFGSVTSAGAEANGLIRVTCGGIGFRNPFNVALSTGASGVYSTRRMQSGAQALNYNLYLNPAHNTIFGNGSGGSSRFDGEMDFVLIGDVTNNVQVYGLIPAQSLPAPGAYTDTITVTVTY